jgi:integrase
VVALAPEQVAVLLDAAGHTSSPWLGPWTVLAAATGARNGELCGLEWADLDLDAGTVRFRQALTIIDPAILPDAATGNGDGDAGGVGDRRKELAVGPVKSAASNAILALPPFAVQALRITATSSAGCAWPLGSPPPYGCAGRSPAGHPARPSLTWCS